MNGAKQMRDKRRKKLFEINREKGIKKVGKVPLPKKKI